MADRVVHYIFASCSSLLSPQCLQFGLVGLVRGGANLARWECCARTPVNGSGASWKLGETWGLFFSLDSHLISRIKSSLYMQFELVTP